MITVAHLITGLETGGAERMLMQLVSRSDRARFRSVVISMTGAGTMGPAIAASGVPLHTLDMRRGIGDPRVITRLGQILRACRPAILQTWLYHADLLGLIARPLGGVPHIVWNLRCTESVGSRAVRRLLSWASPLPDAIVAVSRAGEQFHRALGYRAQRWQVIPNGFDAVALHPDAGARARGRAALGLAESEVAILLPARYHPMKDHANFLAAAVRLAAVRPEAVFMLAGSGIEPDNRPLAEAIAATGLGARVRLFGERRDLTALYPAFDVVTLSSAFGESFPMVLGEAMACGVPCVATDVGEAREIVGATGAVVPPRDSEALAAGWERLVALGAEGRRELGGAARARIVENYELASVIARYEALYEAIAGGATGRPSRLIAGASGRAASS
jgi:glycosyltransferase involved in cell wall biosynthesis